VHEALSRALGRRPAARGRRTYRREPGRRSQAGARRCARIDGVLGDALVAGSPRCTRSPVSVGVAGVREHVASPRATDGGVVHGGHAPSREQPARRVGMSKKKESETGSMKASAAATSPAPAPSPSAPAAPPSPCATEVSATLTLPTEAVALVKKPHQPKASRLEIRLGTDCTFTGTGAFTMTPGGKLKVFDAPQDGNEITGAGLSAIPGADLTGGVTWYLEAVATSGAFE